MEQDKNRHHQNAATIVKYNEAMNPDNSEEKCNIVVKGLDAEVTDKNLEEYFRQFGPIKNCKVAKDPTTGQSKTYGYVWFERSRDANMAMLKYKSGELRWTIDWYKILSQRDNCKFAQKKTEFHDQIFVTWRRIDYDSNNLEGITKDDLKNYYMKFGVIVDMDFQSDANRAFVGFATCDEAEFALSHPKTTIKNHSIWAKSWKERTHATKQPYYGGNRPR